MATIKAALVIPTRNAGPEFASLLEEINSQTFLFVEKIVVDSASEDGTEELARRAGFTVFSIPADSFNHGGTRQEMVRYLADKGQTDIVVFCTQDVSMPDRESTARLIKVFEDETVGCAYGRQLPHGDATVWASHARSFNYPAQGYVRSWEDRHQFGMKTVFISNSFAAYRLQAMEETGGFPDHVILGEDMYAAAKLLMAAWKIAYGADAWVCHSHNYGPWEEGRRYFDIGVMHRRENWIRENFGGADREGLRFVQSEWAYLFQRGQWWKIPEAMFRTVCKYAGYRLGLKEESLPMTWKREISQQKSYWKKERSVIS